MAHRMMSATALSLDHTCHRQSPRSNIFVMATVACDRMSGPVKIRNISHNGALIEALELPERGDRVRLRRGSMSVAGTVAWRSARQAGVRFDRPTEPYYWRPSSQDGPAGVEQATQLAKSNERNASVTALSAYAPRVGEPDELLGIADMVDALSDAICDDPEIVARYMEKLQVLDIVSQKLRKLARR